MNQTVGKIFTRLACILLCIGMLGSTLASCSFGDAVTDIVESGEGETNESPNGDKPSGDTPNGDSPNGDTPSGDTETTYYKVNFAVAIEEYKDRVTLPKEKLYEAGTEIQYLPTPGVKNLLFMGWYYDAAMTRPVALTDKVSSDLMLYAKVVDTSEDIVAIEGVYYHTAYDVDTDYTFSVKADSAEAVELYLSIANISSAGAALVVGEDYTVTDNGDGSFKVSVNYKAGKTYRASLSSDSGLCFVVDGSTLDERVTTLNVLVAKTEVSNLKLADGLIYIPKSDVEMLVDTPNGLVSISENGATVNSGDVGYLSYTGASLKSGDKLAVYEGDIPSARDFGTDNGAVKYLTVTGVEKNNVYKYRVSDSKEVLFIPDIIPVQGKTNVEREVRIAISSLDFNGDLYKQLGLDEDTRIEEGDFIAFFDGPMVEGTAVEYVRIKSVSRDNKYYYVSYTPVSYDDVIASMDIYHTRTNTPELTDEQLELIKASVYKDAMESGFIDDAAAYLVELYLSTGGLESLPNDEIRISSYSVTGNTPNVVKAGSGGLYYEVTKCEAEPDIKVGEGVLKHFENSNGIRVELVLSFEVEFTVGEDGENKVVISAEAVFEEEVLLSVNVDGGAVWKFAGIIPYIADYEMNANIDIGTYTGVSIIAKVYTGNGEEKEEEEDDDSFFPDFDLDNIGKGDSYEEKAKNIGEELKKLFELNDNIEEEIKGEEEDDTGNDITEKYAEMMKDANEAWIEIVRVEIFKQSANLDQLGILWFEMKLDFVVSAQLYIMAGIEVETGVAKRYNFSVALFERSVKTDVIDLEKAHFSFKFYCMGTAGLKVGFEVELSLALLSSDVASVGISAELGVSLGIWGYFYYSYEKEAGEEAEIQKAGAMFFELGIYIEVKFKAHLFNIEKLTYNPTLYENLWPLYSVGTQENVFEFEDYDDAKLVFAMQGTNSIVLPDYIFRMKYLDLKDGKYYSGTGEDDETPSKSFDDETESRFIIEISDSRFSYDPKTNTLSTTVDVKNMGVNDSFEVKLQITYKHGALAFNQEVITREITVQVKNNADYGYIYVYLNGPATLNAVGPGGSSTYAVKHGEAFTLDMLPKYEVKEGYRFVKWIWLQNYRDVNGKLWQEGDEFVGLDSVQKRTYLYLTAVWTPENVDHTVRIFKEAVGGAYVYDRTETVTGLVGSKYDLRGIVDSGYTIRSGDTRSIDIEYGGTHDLYVERATKTIRFLDVDGEGGAITITAKSGSALVPPVVTRAGYTFAGWAKRNTNEIIALPEAVPYESEFKLQTNGADFIYVAIWAPVSDISYTVKHYVQNPNDSGYSLYMTEYATGNNKELIDADDHISQAILDDHFIYARGVDATVELDGSAVVRVYYTRQTFRLRYESNGGNRLNNVSRYAHGQTIDLSTLPSPIKEGYRFVGWSIENDNVAEETMIMPASDAYVYAVWEGVDGIAYRIIHMVKNADDDNYTQVGESYGYGITDSIPAAQSIYDTRYLEDGKFIANYEKAKVEAIFVPYTLYGQDKMATMYAYYDRVSYNVNIKAYDPDTNELVKELNVELPYGRALSDRYLPDLAQFNVSGYNASRYSSSGYTEMPDHDIELTVAYTQNGQTPFLVYHYVQDTNGAYVLRKCVSHKGNVGENLSKSFKSYVLASIESEEYIYADYCSDGVYVARDGSAVLNIYYTRKSATVSGFVYKLDQEGNVVESIYISEEQLLGSFFSGEGYFPYYVFDHIYMPTTGQTITTERGFKVSSIFGHYVLIYLKPMSGVKYTVNWYYEKIDGTGYELNSTYYYVGSQDQVIYAADYARALYGRTLNTAMLNDIVLDAAGENALNLYYDRNVYEVRFINEYLDGGSVTYQVKYGAPIPAAPTNTELAGYDFIEWSGYSDYVGKTISATTLSFYAKYQPAGDTAYKVEHYIKGLDGNYVLVSSEDFTGTTNARISSVDYLLTEYHGNGFASKDDTTLSIAPDGSTVMKIYYDRVSVPFSYHYYMGGKVVGKNSMFLLYGEEIPASINDYSTLYPEYELLGYSVYVNGEYVSISELPQAVGKEEIDIRVELKPIGPDVTIVHKVMNADGVTYTETVTTFVAIPFEELDLSAHLLTTLGTGFTHRIPVNNMIPSATEENVYEIYYDRSTYTVTYINGYDFNWVTEEYIFGAEIGDAPTFTRPGYLHDGWETEIPETMPARNITITARWQAKAAVPVTVIYMMTALDGNGYVEQYRETVYHTPELIIYGSNYVKGVTGGTYKNADKATVAEDGSTEVCVYYTRKEYTVRFTYGDIAGAGEDVVLKLPYGETLEAPDFRVSGYVLVGWSPELSATVPADNVTYTAKWSTESVSITVKHWIEGFDGSNAVTETETLAAKTDSVINGAVYQKTLEGFTYSNADRNVTVSSDGSTVINVYYTRNSYKVTYTYGDKSGNAVEHNVKYGAALPAAPVFSVEGYTFTGWSSEPAATMPSNDLTYEAQWTVSNNTAFTVEHYYQNANDDGYTKVETEIRYGTTNSTVNGADLAKALSEAIFERAESKTVNADGSTVIKVYYKRTTYTLTFTYGDKAGETVEYTLLYGQSISYNPSFTVVGYVFAGWDADIPATMPAQNVKLNATWTAGDGVEYRVEHYLQNANDDNYTLDHTDNRTGVTGAIIDGTALATLIGNGIALKNAETKAIEADGSTVIKIYYDRISYTVTYTYGEREGDSVSYTVRYGAAMPEAPVFTAVGYTFAGWDRAPVAEMPASDITYGAVWTANTDTEFTVEHYYQNANDDGYTVIDGETMYGTTGSVIKGADFKRELDEAILERADEAVIAPDGSTVVRIYYVRTTYTLTFKYGHVSQDEVSYTVRYGAALPKAPEFTAQGYIHRGWLDDEDCMRDQLAEEMPADDLVYYAYWEAREDTKYTVEHYIEQANGNGYDMVYSEIFEGRTGSTLGYPYEYVLYDDGEMYLHERYNTEELEILPDGSAVLKIYYQRVRYAVTFYVVDQNLNPIEGIEPITVEFKYGQTVAPPTVEAPEGYEFARYDTAYEIMPKEEIEYYVVCQCLHLSVDSGHTCETCYDTLECIDSNDDGHCDYGREPIDADDHRYVDKDNDHICDICCGSFTELCFDNDKNGECDVCDQPTTCPVTGEEHIDNDNDHICDDCEVWLSYMCVIRSEDSHECSHCYARLYDMCTDEDHDCRCDVCWDTIPCVDEDGDGFCDLCENQIPCERHVDEDQNALCDRCLENLHWCDEDNYLMHDDSNLDHFCDYCNLWLSYYCNDRNGDGRCEDCYSPAYCMQELGKKHIDEDGDHLCDECGCWMSYVCVDADGDWSCDECGAELACYDHIDEDRNATCDVCGEETRCKENPYDTYHEYSDANHVCDWCGVWLSIYCIDDNYDGYCDECNRELVCEHVDEDEDNYCDRCYRIINCTHESVTEHYCDECYQKVSDCVDGDGDLFCDECYMDMPCQHIGMEGEHMCYTCYEFLNDCVDEDGDGQCDLSEIFPHSVSDRN